MNPGGELVLGATESRDERVRRLVDEHHDRVWRTLRRLGVLPGDVDDATQRVFIVLTRKLWRVRAGAEVKFLIQTAVRVAADFRRSRRRQRLSPEGLDHVELPEPSGDPEELLVLRREREALDRVLDELTTDLRLVFVLYELDGLTMADIAAVTGLRPGTVASRLRRARDIFYARAHRDPEEGK